MREPLKGVAIGVGQAADLVGHGPLDDQLAAQLQADADRLVTAANAVPRQR